MRHAATVVVLLAASVARADPADNSRALPPELREVKFEPLLKEQIPPGNYRVTVTKTTTGGEVNMDPKAKEAAGKGGQSKDYVKDMLTMGKQSKKSELPDKFAAENTTTLTTTVPGGPYDLDLGN